MNLTYAGFLQVMFHLNSLFVKYEIINKGLMMKMTASPKK